MERKVIKKQDEDVIKLKKGEENSSDGFAMHKAEDKINIVNFSNFISAPNNFTLTNYVTMASNVFPFLYQNTFIGQLTKPTKSRSKTNLVNVLYCANVERERIKKKDASMETDHCILRRKICKDWKKLKPYNKLFMIYGGVVTTDTESQCSQSNFAAHYRQRNCWNRSKKIVRANSREATTRRAMHNSRNSDHSADVRKTIKTNCDILSCNTLNSYLGTEMDEVECNIDLKSNKYQYTNETEFVGNMSSRAVQNEKPHSETELSQKIIASNESVSNNLIDLDESNDFLYYKLKESIINVNPDRMKLKYDRSVIEPKFICVRRKFVKHLQRLESVIYIDDLKSNLSQQIKTKNIEKTSVTKKNEQDSIRKHLLRRHRPDRLMNYESTLSLKSSVNEAKDKEKEEKLLYCISLNNVSSTLSPRANVNCKRFFSNSTTKMPERNPKEEAKLPIINDGVISGGFYLKSLKKYRFHDDFTRKTQSMSNLRVSHGTSQGKNKKCFDNEQWKKIRQKRFVYNFEKRDKKLHKKPGIAKHIENIMKYIFECTENSNINIVLNINVQPIFKKYDNNQEEIKINNKKIEKKIQRKSECLVMIQNYGNFYYDKNDNSDNISIAPPMNFNDQNKELIDNSNTSFKNIEINTHIKESHRLETETDHKLNDMVVNCKQMNTECDKLRAGIFSIKSDGYFERDVIDTVNVHHVPSVECKHRSSECSKSDLKSFLAKETGEKFLDVSGDLINVDTLFLNKKYNSKINLLRSVVSEPLMAGRYLKCAELPVFPSQNKIMTVTFIQQYNIEIPILDQIAQQSLTPISSENLIKVTDMTSAYSRENNRKHVTVNQMQTPMRRISSSKNLNNKLKTINKKHKLVSFVCDVFNRNTKSKADCIDFNSTTDVATSLYGEKIEFQQFIKHKRIKGDECTIQIEPELKGVAMSVPLKNQLKSIIKTNEYGNNTSSDNEELPRPTKLRLHIFESCIDIDEKNSTMVRRIRKFARWRIFIFLLMILIPSFICLICYIFQSYLYAGPNERTNLNAKPLSLAEQTAKPELIIDLAEMGF